MSLSSDWKPSVPFEPRAVKFKELLEQGDWRLKVYVILFPENPLNWEILDEGIRFALNALPIPARTPARPGLGFIIAHQGRRSFSVSSCWWDNEYELAHSLFIRPLDGAEQWRNAHEERFTNVWDQEIIWFEREAYVNAILSKSEKPDFEGYLEQRLFG